MIPPGAFFDLREIAIRANRAASGCPLLAVELPAMSRFSKFAAPGMNLPESPFQVSRSRGGRYACSESGIFLCAEPSLLEHNGGIVTCCFFTTVPSQAVVTRSNSKIPIEFP